MRCEWMDRCRSTRIAPISFSGGRWGLAMAPTMRQGLNLMLLAVSKTKPDGSGSKAERLRPGVAIVFASVLCLACCGCGSDDRQSSARESSQQLFDAGLSAFEAGDYEQAAELLGQAMEGPLHPDTLVTAGIHRAKARAHSGQLDDALSILESVEQGLPSEADYQVALGEIYAATGDLPSARKAFSQAKSLDRRIQVPSL